MRLSIPKKTRIDSVTFNAPFVFKNAPSGTYYIQIIHRNALETWSKNGGESVTNGILTNYDFTNSQSNAYGGNTILTGSKWCLFSGDVNSDGSVDITDVVSIYNDAVNFSSGYLATDLTGDETVDVTDLLIGYNNSTNFVSKVTPETSPADIIMQKERSGVKMKAYKEGNSSVVPK
ncbi:MAG: hypothetical protein SGI89_01340 [bacterium]|nr:hypothetical protein [bacterium]